MRLVFMGTPAFALPALQALHGSAHEIIAVYTQPPRPAGRGQKETASPVGVYAAARGLPVLTPVSLKDAGAQAAFAAHKADIAVVAAYGLLLPKAILAAYPHGCINIHPSLLPRWRGAAPIQRALMAGDAETGVCIMQMDEGLDTGDVLLRERFAVAQEMNAGQLHDALAAMGARLLLKALDAIPHGGMRAEAQISDGVTYANKIGKEDCRIDWRRPAAELHNLVRALSPHPGAFFAYNGEQIKVFSATVSTDSGVPGTVLDGGFTIACGQGSLTLLEVQRQGKKRMPAAEMLKGLPIPHGVYCRMPRYKLLVEYNGSGFAGWQKASGLPSVQETLKEALFRFCGEQAQVTGAGRTDAGVHASGQVAHIDLSKAHEAFTVMNAVNFHLLAIAARVYPMGVSERLISVLAAEAVPDDFHARFSAKGRHYVYRILNRRPPPALNAPFVWHVPEALDTRAMQEAARILLGHHDFSSFRDTRCQAKSPMKTLGRLEVECAGEEIRLHVSARSFLHHQVRIMAGTLKWIGSGRWAPQHMAHMLAARDRTQAGPTAPAQGLCLTRVDY